MQIHVSLVEVSEDLAALQVARFLCDLQHLTVFAVALAHEDLSSELDLFDHLQSKYEFMILGDLVGLDESRLFVKEMSLQSPLSVKVGFFFKGPSKTLKTILEALKTVITFDHMRERAAIENDLLKEELVKKKLSNIDHVLRIGSRLRDPARRAAFEENLASALRPFIDGRYPPIDRIDIVDPSASGQRRR
jgi:hypothetical protein